MGESDEVTQVKSECEPMIVDNLASTCGASYTFKQLICLNCVHVYYLPLMHSCNKTNLKSWKLFNILDLLNCVLLELFGSFMNFIDFLYSKFVIVFLNLIRSKISVIREDLNDSLNGLVIYWHVLNAALHFPRLSVGEFFGLVHESLLVRRHLRDDILWLHDLLQAPVNLIGLFLAHTWLIVRRLHALLEKVLGYLQRLEVLFAVSQNLFYWSRRTTERVLALTFNNVFLAL